MTKADEILQFMNEAVESEKMLNPEIWIKAAQELNLALAEEHEHLFDLQQEVANMKVHYLIETEKNVSAAIIMTETTDKYKEWSIQKAKVGRIEEFVRIAKIRSKVAGGF